MAEKEYIEREKVLALQTELHFDNIEQLKHWKCRHIDPTEVRLLPAADVRPVVKAKWELDSDKLPICSNCGEIALQRIFVKVPHLIQDVRMVRSNFCPNCGADMREES